MSHWKTILLAGFVLGIAGCSGSGRQDDSGGLYDSAGMQSGDGAGASSYPDDSGTLDDGAYIDEQTGAMAVLMNERIVYFNFDSSEILPASAEILARHAQYLADNPGTQVTLEGHTDERGSREYNIGLGEQRAQAVKDVLLVQGGRTGQLTTVSYGEERPAAIGSNEEAWALNRRVELVYQ